MTHLQRIQAHLLTRPGLCDDCLSSELQIRPRQAVNGVCSRSPSIHRSNGDCVACRKSKIVRSLGPTDLIQDSKVSLLTTSPPSNQKRFANAQTNRGHYAREEDLRSKFNASIAKTLRIEIQDFYGRLSFAELLELKTAYARIHDIVTLKLTLELVDWLVTQFELDQTAGEQLRSSISMLHPNTSGFDIDHAEPNFIAEVKGTIPVNAGNAFGAAQTRSLTNDVLQMLGRPPGGKLETQLSARAKIRRPKREAALKFMALYDSPEVKAATARWRKGLAAELKPLIRDLPDSGQLWPEAVYLVYLKPRAGKAVTLDA